MMIDPELQYCPKCNDEYRAEIVTCAACETTLLSGVELLARQRAGSERRTVRQGKLRKDEDLVSVRRGPLGEMRAYEALLAVEGIATMLAGDEHSCGKGCCPSSFDLVVRREEAGEALQMIEVEIRRTAPLDGPAGSHHDAVYHDQAAAIICPACGHHFPTAKECPECGLCF